MINVSDLQKLMRYCPETGALFWKERPREFFKKDGECIRWNGRYAGREAFRVSGNGYRSGMIFRKMHMAHKVCWALHYGEWPNGFIDHINGNRSDNRIINLRVVTKSENSRNRKQHKHNKTGATGVHEFKPGRWRVTIGTNDGNLHVGVFYSLEEAIDARKAAEAAHGYHPNHGRAA